MYKFVYLLTATVAWTDAREHGVQNYTRVDGPCSWRSQYISEHLRR